MRRYLEKFTSIDGSESYTFPVYRFEWTRTRPKRTSMASIPGASGAHRFGGYAQAAGEVGRERLRCMVVSDTILATDAAQDAALACAEIDFGWLYILNGDGSRRKALAQIAAAPEITVNEDHFTKQPLVFDFIRLSDWLDTAPEVITETITTSPADIVVPNPGNATCYWVTVQLKANTSAGITDPTIENLSTGYSIEFDWSSASADDELKVDSELGTVEQSDDDGGSYTDAYDLATPGAEQVLLFAVKPGDNTVRLTCGGTPNYDAVFTFSAPWH